MYYTVEVLDRQTRMVVVVGNALSKAEAMKLSNVLKTYNACEVFVKEFHWYSKKGKLV